LFEAIAVLAEIFGIAAGESPVVAPKFAAAG